MIKGLVRKLSKVLIRLTLLNTYQYHRHYYHNSNRNFPRNGTVSTSMVSITVVRIKSKLRRANCSSSSRFEHVLSSRLSVLSFVITHSRRMTFSESIDRSSCTLTGNF